MKQAEERMEQMKMEMEKMEQYKCALETANQEAHQEKERQAIEMQK